MNPRVDSSFSKQTGTVVQLLAYIWNVKVGEDIMLAMWIYMRVLLLLVAYGGVLVAAQLFPVSPIWSFSSFVGEVLFSPFKLLAAVVLFVVGFLAYSLFVRDIVRLCIPHFSFISMRLPRMFFACAALLSLIHLFMKSGGVALVALMLAVWYGIMDVGFYRK